MSTPFSSPPKSASGSPSTSETLIRVSLSPFRFPNLPLCTTPEASSSDDPFHLNSPSMMGLANSHLFGDSPEISYNHPRSAVRLSFDMLSEFGTPDPNELDKEPSEWSDMCNAFCKRRLSSEGVQEEPANKMQRFDSLETPPVNDLSAVVPVVESCLAEPLPTVTDKPLPAVDDNLSAAVPVSQIMGPHLSTTLPPFSKSRKMDPPMVEELRIGNNLPAVQADELLDDEHIPAVADNLSAVVIVPPMVNPSSLRPLPLVSECQMVNSRSLKEHLPVENPLPADHTDEILNPIPLSQIMENPPEVSISQALVTPVVRRCRQFWRAGDPDVTHHDGASSPSSSDLAIEPMKVPPSFLHSNATSQEWILGAFAQLMDNSIAESSHGATYMNIDMLQSKKDGSNMLLIQDDGAGMDPNVLRQCISTVYPAKSKVAKAIGKNGNGFKASTMRLGADAIVFSRCLGKDRQSCTQSIGMLSYTYLDLTRKEGIVVPMLDYKKRGTNWEKYDLSSTNNWEVNVKTITKWSPYLSEDDLLEQCNLMENQGTRIVIYNLWDNEEGTPELDFDTDQYDIRVRGLKKGEKKKELVNQYPNPTHCLTYSHSLRSYASILYLNLPPGFRIILRGKDVKHHKLEDDMMLQGEDKYKPKQRAEEHGSLGGVEDGHQKGIVIKIGFFKDGRDNTVDQGFNVYHKNRLIKPFWKVLSRAESVGRGVIGILEANFLEPEQHKQDFPYSPLLTRLEAKLAHTQKIYWKSNCEKIGYAPSTKSTGNGTSTNVESTSAGGGVTTPVTSGPSKAANSRQHKAASAGSSKASNRHSRKRSK